MSTGVIFILGKGVTPILAYGVKSTWPQGSSAPGFSNISTATGRVVYRGNSYAYANGGVSCAYASYDVSYSYANVGSRLAFRGLLVRAQSVAAYKALSEVA